MLVRNIPKMLLLFDLFGLTNDWEDCFNSIVVDEGERTVVGPVCFVLEVGVWDSLDIVCSVWAVWFAEVGDQEADVSVIVVVELLRGLVVVVVLWLGCLVVVELWTGYVVGVGEASIHEILNVLSLLSTKWIALKIFYSMFSSFPRNEYYKCISFDHIFFWLNFN